jgi:hypothetical protein
VRRPQIVDARNGCTIAAAHACLKHLIILEFENGPQQSSAANRFKMARFARVPSRPGTGRDPVRRGGTDGAVRTYHSTGSRIGPRKDVLGENSQR